VVKSAALPAAQYLIGHHSIASVPAAKHFPTDVLISSYSALTWFRVAKTEYLKHVSKYWAKQQST